MPDVASTAQDQPDGAVDPIQKRAYLAAKGVSPVSIEATLLRDANPGKIRFLPCNILIPTEEPDPNRESDLKPTTDFEEFVTIWTPKIQSMVAIAGIFNQDLEDLTQEIFLKMYETELLSKYDVRRGVKFSTFIRGNVRFYIATFRARLAKLASRELQSSVMDESRIGSGDEDEEAASFANLEGGSVHPVDEEAIEFLNIIETNDAIRFTYELLSKLPTTATKDYAALFADMVEQAVLDGEVSQKELAAKRGFSRQAVQQHIKQLLAIDAMRALHGVLTARTA